VILPREKAKKENLKWRARDGDNKTPRCNLEEKRPREKEKGKQRRQTQLKVGTNFRRGKNLESTDGNRLEKKSLELKQKGASLAA